MNNQNPVQLFKALGDSTRIHIVSLLAQNGTMCACKILDELNVTQGTLSHHMKILTSVGLVSFVKEGKWCHYSLVTENVCRLSDFLRDIGTQNVVCNCDC